MCRTVNRVIRIAGRQREYFFHLTCDVRMHRSQKFEHVGCCVFSLFSNALGNELKLRIPSTVTTFQILLTFWLRMIWLPHWTRQIVRPEWQIELRIADYDNKPSYVSPWCRMKKNYSSRESLTQASLHVSINKSTLPFGSILWTWRFFTFTYPWSSER